MQNKANQTNPDFYKSYEIAETMLQNLQRTPPNQTTSQTSNSKPVPQNTPNK